MVLIDYLLNHLFENDLIMEIYDKFSRFVFIKKN